jgi:hypothetical protein
MVKTIGIIRGDELEHKESLNSTLLFAKLRYAVGVYFKKIISAK